MRKRNLRANLFAGACVLFLGNILINGILSRPYRVEHARLAKELDGIQSKIVAAETVNSKYGVREPIEFVKYLSSLVKERDSIALDVNRNAEAFLKYDHRTLFYGYFTH